MNTFVIVRPFSMDEEGKLGPESQTQSKRLVDGLLAYTYRRTVRIYCAQTSSSVQTAMLLSSRLKCTNTGERKLGENGGPSYAEDALDFVKRTEPQAGVFIVIVHEPTLRDLPLLFYEDRFEEPAPEFDELGPGEAVAFDLVEGKVEQLIYR